MTSAEKLRFCAALLAAMVFPTLSVHAQSTQGLMTGRVVDSESGRPIPSARVAWTYATTAIGGASSTGTDGYYYLPQLSPGMYRIRVSADQYQTQELQELELLVAARLELNFRLRPLHDVWEQGQYRSVFLPGSHVVLNYFGPDLDSTRSGSFEGQRERSGALEATISEVIEPELIRDLPLAGRDVYTALVLLPGVTSDGATARGLGLSANGQRPSSSNYFLDGLEYNDNLITGPIVPIAPEAIQEYRVSTNNFTAQYGGTTGFIANAVTRSGGKEYHGTLYSYLQNDALNGNDFQRNLQGLHRPSDKILHTGFQVGGPVWRERRLFFSSAFEYLRSRTELSATRYNLPTATLLAATAPGSIAHLLLSTYPSAGLRVTGPMSATFVFAPPVSIDRSLALERADYNSSDGRHRLSARLALARLHQPDFTWSPFRGMNTPLSQDTSSFGISHFFSLGQHVFNEAKLGFNGGDLHWTRPHPEIPILSAGVLLPSSVSDFSYKNATSHRQLLDNLIWTHGRHLYTIGGDALWRSLDGYLTLLRDGELQFNNLMKFATDTPAYFLSSASYRNPSLRPGYDRSYRIGEYALFVQDTYRASPRLTLNFGLRYENFGSPRNTGLVKDAVLQLGPGSTIAERLGTAQFAALQGGDQTLYRADPYGWEPRLGVSYDLFGNGRTIVRSGYGIFQDRLFDNLWQTVRVNDLSYLFYPVGRPLANYSGETLTSSLQSQGSPLNPRLTLLDPHLRNGRSYSYFAGLVHTLNRSVSMEVNTLGALGRNLLTTDKINRIPASSADTFINPFLPPDIRFRSSQGISDYHALTAALHYRTSNAQFHLIYTWSHAIDNQSEPIESDLFDFRPTPSQASTIVLPVGFARQFDSAGDRGSSDFDQRQSLVFYSTWQSPGRGDSKLAGRLLRNWQLSELAAFRSGFPFSINEGGRRADIIDPRNAVTDLPVNGGILTLDRNAFQAPLDTVGNSGRNAFRGPGFYSVDVSLSRIFSFSPLGESGRLVVRADAFNVLNHANLSSPNNSLNSPLFGVAAYGRTGFGSGFPAATPLNETPRQLRLGMRLEF